MKLLRSKKIATTLVIAIILIALCCATLVEAHNNSYFNSYKSTVSLCSQPSDGTSTTDTSDSNNDATATPTTDTSDSNNDVTATPTTDTSASSSDNNASTSTKGSHSSHSSQHNNGTATTDSTATATTDTNAGNSSNATTTPTNTATSGTPCSTQNANTASTPLKGIYEFSGNNFSTHATNQAIAGTNLVYYWAQLEPKQGQYNWNQIDQDIQPWANNHKHVILRVSTAGWTGWNKSANSGHATPQWVYDQGVQSVTETDQAVLPQYWNPKFLQDLQDFITAFAKHYDGNQNISAVEIGIGDGGETKVDTRKVTSNPQLLQQWQGIGYTDAVWMDTIQKIITIYKTAFQQTPLVVMPDGSFIGKTPGYGETMVLDYVAANSNGRLWLQDNGVGANHTLTGPAWKKVPIVAEQLLQTSQSGDTLQQDLQSALNEGATYILIFANDIDQSANQSVLQQFTAQINSASGTSVATSTSASNDTPGATNTSTTSGPITASAPGNPTLTMLSQIATNADSTGGVDNGWGTHKTRIIRLSNSNIFTVYKDTNLTFHVLKITPDGNSKEVLSGPSGPEPINIIRGANDEIHVFARLHQDNNGDNNNDGQSTVVHYVSTDGGQSFPKEDIPGGWGANDQGYGGAGTNAQGDIVYGLTNQDVPGQFIFSYYSHITKQWTAHEIHFPIRYTYPFFFPGPNGDLTITGTRDDHPDEEGYSGLSMNNSGYLFDRIGYFYIPNVNSGANPQFTQTDLVVGHPEGHQLSDFDNLIDQSDAYIDTQGRLHVLYFDQFDGSHHLIAQNGNVIKDVKINIDSDSDQNNKMRLVQDTKGHFYIINIASDGQLEVYSGTANDTDGTQLGPVLKLDNTKYPGCDDHDNCHSASLTVPRSGNAISDTIDGVYGNFGKEIYFQIKLR